MLNYTIVKSQENIMKIQIISQMFYPDNFRINEISKELAKHCHDVHVLTGLPDYTTSRVPKEYRFFKKRRERIGKVYVKRVSTFARHSGVFFRVLNYVSFMINASIYALLSKNIHADSIFVYQTSPVFQALAGIVYKWKYKKPLVIYCCDLWPESMKAWGIGEKSIIFKAVKAISSWIYRKADTVAVSSKPFREYLCNVCLVNDKKIVYLPQHAEDFFSNISGQYSDNGIIDFLFAGNMGAVQNLEIIIKAAAKISSTKIFKIHLVGDGSEFENIKALITDLGINDKVLLHGRHPLEKMNDFYKLADCFLLPLRGGDFIGMTLPGKAQGYLSAGKPVLSVLDGAGQELIKTADCGEAVNYNDLDGLIKAFEKIINNFEDYKIKGLNGRRYYEDNFTKDIFINRLVNILDNGDGK